MVAQKSLNRLADARLRMYGIHDGNVEVVSSATQCAAYSFERLPPAFASMQCHKYRAGVTKSCAAPGFRWRGQIGPFRHVLNDVDDRVSGEHHSVPRYTFTQEVQ